MHRDALDREHDRQRRPSREFESDRERQRDSDGYRKRRTHRATDSQGEILQRHEDESPRETIPRKKRQSASKSGSSNAPLRIESLAQLNALNERRGWKGYDEAYLQEVRAKEGRMERERRQEEKEMERERRRAQRRAEREEQQRRAEMERERQFEADKQRAREEERKRRREERRRLRQLEVEDRQQENEIARETKRHMWGREREPENVMEDEHTDSEENERQEMKSYWAKRTQYEKEKEQRRVASSDTDGRTRIKKRRLVSGPQLEEGESDKRRKNHENKRLKDGSGGRSEYTDSEWRRKRNMRICMCNWLLLFGLCLPSFKVSV